MDSPVEVRGQDKESKSSLRIHNAESHEAFELTQELPKGVDTGSLKNEKGSDAKGEKVAAYDVDDHLISLEDLSARYGTHLDPASIVRSKGLDEATAAARLQADGPNLLSPPKELPEILKFLKHFLNPLMMLLIIAALLCFLAYAVASNRDWHNYVLGIALIVTVFFTCVMSYFQERAAGKVMAALANMIPNKCIVIRDGKERQINATELVKGDLIRLSIGDRIPADVRIVYSNDLKVDCSLLTGESDLIPASVEKKHDLVLEARNVMFMSCLCMNGEARGVVIRTGDNTMIGQIASLASKQTVQKSTLQIEVERLVKFIAILGTTTGIVFFCIGIARTCTDEGGCSTDGIVNAFVNGFILVLVANVPEGLPATVMSCLTITAQRLRDRNVLIKRSDIIENLGAATVIASDKTGTLTQNRMTVENVWVNRTFRAGHGFATGAGESTLVEMKDDSNQATYHSRGRPSAALARASRTMELAARKSTTDPLAAMAKAHEGAMAKARASINAVRPSVGAGARDTRTAPVTDTMRALQTFNLSNMVIGTDVCWTNTSPFTKLVTMASVCNRARFDAADGTPSSAFSSSDDRKVLGDATDSGLLRFVDRLTNYQLLRDLYNKLYEVPFSSVHKYMYTVCEIPNEKGTHVAFMKGAPEIVLTHCTHYFYNDVERPIDEDYKADLMTAYERCGLMGERVIGFAYKTFAARDPESYKNCDGTDREPPKDDLVFMGLVSLVDPPRPGVPEAVQKCRSAGISVVMVTGDHPLTAEAIARKVGIVTLPTRREIAADDGVAAERIPLSDPRVQAAVVTGAELLEVKTNSQWDIILDKPEIVFARTSPQQKLEIVLNLQRRGEVVAVTGDGVNDAPALRQAQIGVGMGSANASDVAREAADIVLMDDQFSSIVMAIEEGRIIYDNLKKSIAYTLAHAIPELWPVFMNIAFEMPLGLVGLCILTIDLVTEQGPAISLAYEKAEKNVMNRLPRDIDTDRLVSGPLLRYAYLIVGVMEAFWCMMAYFATFWWHGISLSAVWNSSNTFFQPEGTVDSPPPLPGYPDIDGEQQMIIYRQAQASWYLTLIMCQFWHIWVCKTRTVSIFKHGIFDNKITIFGVLISLCVMCMVVYIPALNNVFYTNAVVGVAWTLNLGFLICILTWSEVVKKFARDDPDCFAARHLAW